MGKPTACSSSSFASCFPRSRSFWIVALALLLASRPAAGAEPGLFAQANRAYEEGAYTNAITAYEALLNQGVSSPSLHFNLGNAWFRLGNPGLAIVHYRLASTQAPRDPDIRANLQFARQSVDGGLSPPTPRWQRWLNHLSLREWTFLWVFSWWSLCLALILRRLRGRFPLAAGWIATSLLASGLTFTATLAVTWALQNRTVAVVIHPDAVARYGPLAESQPSFTAKNGTELPVLDQQGSWVQVTDAARRTGWIHTDDVKLLPGW